MLGIDPKDLPEIKEKYALELWQALQNQESHISSKNTSYHAEWEF